MFFKATNVGPPVLFSRGQRDKLSLDSLDKSGQNIGENCGPKLCTFGLSTPGLHRGVSQSHMFTTGKPASEFFAMTGTTIQCTGNQADKLCSIGSKTIDASQSNDQSAWVNSPQSNLRGCISFSSIHLLVLLMLANWSPGFPAKNPGPQLWGNYSV